MSELGAQIAWAVAVLLGFAAFGWWCWRDSRKCQVCGVDHDARKPVYRFAKGVWVPTDGYPHKEPVWVCYKGKWEVLDANLANYALKRRHQH